MPLSESRNNTSQFLSAALSAAVVAIFSAGLNFAGWLFDIPLLVRLSSSGPNMQPLTAVLVAAAGVALAAAVLGKPAIKYMAIGIIFAISIVTLRAYASVELFALNRILFWDRVSEQKFYAHPGWPGPASVVGFVLFATSLVLHGIPQFARFGCVPSTLGFAYALQALLANLFSADQLMFAAFHLQAMAVPTALALVILNLGVLLQNAQFNWVGTLLAPGVIPKAARRLVAVVVSITVVVNWLGWMAATEGSTPGLFLPPLLTAIAVLILGSVILTYTARLIRADLARTEAEEHARFLTNEIIHRSKNILTVVQVLGTQSIANGNTLDQCRKKFTDRIGAYSRSIEITSHGDGVTLQRLLEDNFAPFVSLTSGRLRIVGPPVVLSAEPAQQLGMAFHELVTNACKYGALSRETGSISVEWSVQPGSDRLLLLSWTESGGPAVVPPASKGFGSRVIERMLQQSIKADISFDFRTDGLIVLIRVPLSAIAAPKQKTATLKRG